VEGARVVIADLNDEAGEGVVRGLGAAAAYRHADVGSLADLEAAVAFARERFGGLDVMHNNAAMSGGGYVAEIEPEVWEQSLRVMLTGVFYGMRAAIPALLARGGGSIISTSSVEGFFGEMLAAPYCTAKAGIINLTRTVALEYGRKNIRANCICPGAVDTPMLGLLAPARGDRERGALPRQRRVLRDHGRGDRGRRRAHVRARDHGAAAVRQLAATPRRYRGSPGKLVSGAPIWRSLPAW